METISDGCLLLGLAALLPIYDEGLGRFNILKTIAMGVLESVFSSPIRAVKFSSLKLIYRFSPAVDVEVVFLVGTFWVLVYIYKNLLSF
jgi:hypothetical protein